VELGANVLATLRL